MAKLRAVSPVMVDRVLMDWGTAPAWVAIVVSIGAAYVAYMAQRNSKRSADTAARALQLQEEAADERRPAAQARAVLALEKADGTSAWVLRDCGTATAENITVEDDGTAVTD